MKIEVLADKTALGKAAAQAGAIALRDALAIKSEISIVVATGASQFEMLDSLVNMPDIDWGRVNIFHLDEYIGLPETHPASFRKYLKERFLARIPTVKSFIGVDGSTKNIPAEISRLNILIATREIDLCIAGIGENGHLAFNDPPADFEVTDPYIVVTLNDACRRQQMGEGWFASIDEVPQQAISMSIQQIIRARKIILSVPDLRKANAVKGAVEGAISAQCPASILQRHADCILFLDPLSASALFPVKS